MALSLNTFCRISDKNKTAESQNRFDYSFKFKIVVYEILLWDDKPQTNKDKTKMYYIVTSDCFLLFTRKLFYVSTIFKVAST